MSFDFTGEEAIDTEPLAEMALGIEPISGGNEIRMNRHL